MEKSLEDLEKEITCGICQEHYTEPKVLPCLHYYCKQCVQTMSATATSLQPLACPKCHEEASLPEGKVDNLSTAFFVNRLKAMHATMERVHGMVDLECELCTDSEARVEAFCRQCAEFICAKCAESHKRMRTFAGHEVVALQDLRDGSASQIVPKEFSLLASKCSVHEEPLIMFCFDCNTLTCHYCTLKDHRNHNCDFCSVAAPKTKTILLQQTDTLRDLKQNMLSSVERMQTTRDDIKDQGELVATSVQTSFAELQSMLEARKQHLLEDVKSLVKEKTDNILKREQNMSTACSTVDFVIDYTERCVNHCADDEMMLMHADVGKRIKLEIDHYNSLEVLDGPTLEADMGFEMLCAGEIQNLCQTKCRMGQIPIDASKCLIIDSDLLKVEILKPSFVTLVVKLANGNTTNHSINVNGRLQSLVKGTVIKCTIDRIKYGEYRLEYTPIVRGRHVLSVSLNGVHLVGSPFPVFVSLPPTQLTVSKVWCGLDWPLGITANSAGEIIVAEGKKNITIIGKDGKRVGSIKAVDHHFQLLAGVSVDREDNIYIIDLKTNLIYKSNKERTTIQVHQVEIKKEDKQGHVGITCVGDELMVCEYGNEGCITVYDREIQFVRHIIGENMGTFVDVSADSQGNLFVIDYTNSCIRVFSNEGECIRSFGSDSAGEKRLSQPLGVCIAGEHVYVTDIGNDNMSVFTKEGEFVASFGQRGNKIGDFSCPGGVCVDQDGFVYICDCGNNRIQIF